MQNNSVPIYRTFSPCSSMESTEDVPADIESKEVEKQELEENEETPDEVKVDEVKIDEVKIDEVTIDEVKIDEESPKEVTKAADDIFENVSDDDGLMFANPTVETVEIAKKPVHTESDLFDDVSEGEDLFDNTSPIEEEATKEEHIFGIDEDDQKDDKDDLAGIDDKDLFTGNSQQCDLFDDDDDDEDTIESNMQGAIPVRMNSGLFVVFSKHLLLDISGYSGHVHINLVARYFLLCVKVNISYITNC